MKPYYEHGGIRIFLGDSREIVPSLGRFDLLLTDPPYGMGRDGKPKSTSSHGGHKGYEFLGWDSEAPTKETFDMIFACCNDQIVWGANFFPYALPPSMKWIVWDKGQRIDQSDGELAFTSLPGALRIFTLNRVALQKDGAEHPTQKPLELMRWCLIQAGQPKTVLDPYMGVGTTLRACKDAGIESCGIEREERYCEIAARRLEQEVFAF